MNYEYTDFFSSKINVLRAAALVPHDHTLLFNNAIHFLRRIDVLTGTFTLLNFLCTLVEGLTRNKNVIE